jgi:hypothetical protein
VKKVFEVFCKFYLMQDGKEQIMDLIKDEFNEANSKECFFIVPEGSNFKNALKKTIKIP